VDLRDTPEQAEFRSRLRAWIETNMPSEPEPSTQPERFHYVVAWQKKLYAGGWVALSWPKDYGGQGLGPIEESILNQELGRAGAPAAASFTFLGRAVLSSGTEEQKKRYLPGFLSAEEIWCQGFSEPESGSDLASLRTTAVLDDAGNFVINGQKLWTSRGSFAHYCLVLARTGSPDSRHRGISALIVPMDTPGVSRRPLIMSNGDEEFAEVFFDDVVVPAENLLGEFNGGWKVTQATLAYERGAADLGYLAKYERLLAELSGVAVQRGLAQDAGTAESVGRVLMHLEVLRLHSQRRLSDRARGRPVGSETSIDKLTMTQTEQLLLHTALDIVGPAAALGQGGWFKKYLYSRAASIYGGTSQIQRNVISGRLLGLKE
jgi:alkylation response protein AidB-like acyl-CoA dehydrogenase